MDIRKNDFVTNEANVRLLLQSRTQHEALLRIAVSVAQNELEASAFAARNQMQLPMPSAENHAIDTTLQNVAPLALVMWQRANNELNKVLERAIRALAHRVESHITTLQKRQGYTEKIAILPNVSGHQHHFQMVTAHPLYQKLQENVRKLYPDVHLEVNALLTMPSSFARDDPDYYKLFLILEHRVPTQESSLLPD